MGPSMAEICIKHIGVVVTAYFIVLRSAKEAYTVRQKLFGGVGALLIGILIGCIYDWLPMCSVVLLLLLYYLMMRGVFRPGTSALYALSGRLSRKKSCEPVTVRSFSARAVSV